MCLIVNQVQALHEYYERSKASDHREMHATCVQKLSFTTNQQEIFKLLPSAVPCPAHQHTHQTLQDLNSLNIYLLFAIFLSESVSQSETERVEASSRLAIGSPTCS